MGHGLVDRFEWKDPIPDRADGPSLLSASSPWAAGDPRTTIAFGHPSHSTLSTKIRAVIYRLTTTGVVHVRAFVPALLATVFASGTCANAPGAAPVNGDFDVGGRTIHIRCEGRGAPVVVVDAGMGTAPAEDSAWLGIAAKVSKVTTICLYDRAGLGKSEKAPPGTRTSADAARDLHLALLAARLPGPFLLAGHSIGGLNAQVFASRYPDETAGLVLVSSTHPDQVQTWLSLLPPPATDEDKGITGARAFLTGLATDPTKNPETLDFAASSTQARELRALGSRPVIVATHNPRFRMDPALPESVAVRLEAATQRMQKEFLSLSTRSVQHIAASAGHEIPHEDPDFVTDNILEGVAMVRAKR